MKERLALTSPDTAALLLARRVVAEVTYAFGLDRMAPVLMGDGFDPVELRHRFEGIAQSNPLGELADLIDVTSLTQQEMVRLYRAYVEEWSSHEDAVRSYGLAQRERRTVA